MSNPVIVFAFSELNAKVLNPPNDTEFSKSHLVTLHQEKLPQNTSQTRIY